MSDDLTTWLHEQITAAETSTRTLLYWAQQTILELKEPKLLGKRIPGWHDWPDVEQVCHDRLADLDAKRRILAEHQPKWRTVEWPHDQNGKGEAQVCRRCENAEHSTWNPPVGQAGVLPEGFIVPVRPRALPDAAPADPPVCRPARIPGKVAAMSGVDWKLIRSGCPRCGAQQGGPRGLHWHALSVWCLNCRWGRNWSQP